MSNLFSIIKYESLMLLRTWKFWILALIGMFIPIMMTTMITILTMIGESLPGWMGLKGAPPFMLFNFYNSIQILIVIFLTSDFREKDKKCQVDQVMSCKPMTNFEYIFGKYLGIVIPLNILTFVVIILLTIMNKFMNGAWSLGFYIHDFFLTNLPGLLFITAVIIFASSLLRNTAVVFVIVVAYTIGMWKLAADHAFDVNRLWMYADYVGYFLPMFPSDMVGVINEPEIILQRTFYVLIGFFFMGVTIALFYPRLNQSLKSEIIALTMSVACLFGAGKIFYDQWEKENSRLSVVSSITDGGQNIEQQSGLKVQEYNMNYILGGEDQPLKGQAAITVVNSSNLPIETIPFALNIALKVDEIQDVSGSELKYTREGTNLLVKLSSSVLAGSMAEIILKYSGGIDNTTIFLNRAAIDKGELAKFGNEEGPFSNASVDDAVSYISEDFSYFLNESFWYPVLYNPNNFDYPVKRPESFFTGNWSFEVPKGDTAVSQGELASIDSVSVEGKIIYNYTSSVPLKSLMLISGDYKNYSTEIGDVDFKLYVSKEHDNIPKFFEESSEDIIKVLNDVFRGIKEITGLEYPYESLKYIEVPLTLQFYQNNGLKKNLLSNAGIVLLPEYLLAKTYQERFDRIKRNADRRGIEKSDRAIKKEIFIDIIIDEMFSENWWNDEGIAPPITAFWSDRLSFSGGIYPVFEYYFDKFLQEQIANQMYFYVTNDSKEQTANVESSFSDWQFSRLYDIPVDTMQYLVRTFPVSEIIPSNDNKNFHAVMKYKGQKLHKLLKEIMEDSQYSSALSEFVKENSYKTSTPADLQRSFEKYYGEDLDWFFKDWLEGTAYPGFMITSLNVHKVKGGESGVQYFVNVAIKNGEKDKGFVNVVLWTESDKVRKKSIIEGHQEVKFGFLLDDIPKKIVIDPVYSRNDGGLFRTLNVPDRFEKIVTFDGIQKMDDKNSKYDEIVVDDLDEGFELIPTGVTEYLRPEEDEKSWRLRTGSEAFGKYKMTYRRKEGGTAAVPAFWTIEVPYTGTYDLQMYLFLGSSNWEYGYYGRRVEPIFYYTVTNGDDETKIDFETKGLSTGWYELGRLELKEGDKIRIRLDDIGKGFIMADAMKLIPIKLASGIEEQ